MVSFLPLKRLDIRVRPGSAGGDCLAVEGICVSGGGAEVAVAPSAFARFVVEANLGEASGRADTWEDAVGKPLAVSVLVHAGGRVLALRRRGDLAVQSGLWTASVTGTAVPADAANGDALARAALRELAEETGLAAGSGRLALLGLALAPGKAQAVGLFEFACARPPGEVLASILAWPRFREEHEGAEFLEPDRALGLRLSPVSRLAVELFRGGRPPAAACSAGDREREALRRLASLDALTGLLNRSGFRGRAEEALRSAGRAALVVFDLDGLKLVNDRYGHRAGDEVLRSFADVLAAAARERAGALAARLGGDEFAVLLPGAGRAEAEAFAERVLTDPRLDASPASRLSPSGGMCAGWGAAVWPDDAADADGLLAAADAELRRAKARRNGFALAFSTALARFGEALSLDEAEAVFEAALTLTGKAEPGLRAHCERVGLMSGLLAARAGLGDGPARLARLAGRLHDIGKVGVGPGLLRKNGPLTPDERASAERHPVVGAEMLRSVPVLVPVAEAVLHHHEKWDGTGYPGGLEGGEIPVLARVVALADAWDAMTHDRPYQGALPGSEALSRILAAAGSHFDPHLAGVFASLVREEGLA